MFWKKTKKKPKSNFKIGDLIKFKEGIEHDLYGVEDISDWQGRVVEIYGNGIEIELDSITLKNLDEAYIDTCFENQKEPHVLIFPVEDLVLAQARDNEEDVQKEQDILIDRIDKKNKVPKYRRDYLKWVRHFQRDKAFKDMDKKHKKHTDFILKTFFNYMYDYTGKTPQKWNLPAAKEVLLHYVPTKISAEKETFEVYGDVLLAYFKFLQERRYVGTKSLQQLVIKVKDKIVENSQDRSTWGPAKTFMMAAIDAEVDMEDEKAMKKFMMKQQLKALLGFNKK